MPNITIKEVAEKAGCSAMTVSNVINKRRSVKPEIAGKVMKAIDELGYQPSQWARHLALRRMNKNTPTPLTRRFGCIMDAPSTGKYADPYFGEVMEALEQELNRRNYELSFVEQWSSLAGSERLGRILNPENIDVLVLLNCELLLPQVKRYLKKNIVAIGNFFSDREVDYVSCDVVNSGKMATDYLLGMGHRNIIYMGPVIPPEYASHERETGYKLALMNHPDHPTPRVIHLKTDDWEDAYEESLRILTGPNRPTGIFAHSDITAIAAIKAANKAGLRVPDDLSVVGFDDVYLAELSQPALTTIRVNKAGIGQIVAQSGLDRLENPDLPPRISILPGELVIRESCMPPKTSV